MGPAVSVDCGEIYAVNAWMPDTLLRVGLPTSICHLMDNDELECRETHGCLWCSGLLNVTYCFAASSSEPPPTYACQPLAVYLL